MRKIVVFPLALLFSLPVCVRTLAQDAPAGVTPQPMPSVDAKTLGRTPRDYRYYHLEFAVREVGEDGKVANSRSYSMIVGFDDLHPGNQQPSSIRAGSRVPVYQNGSKTTFEYRDIGVNIDCRDVHLNQNNLLLHVGAEISSLADSEAGNSPVIRQNKWESEVTLPLNKLTVLFASDNVSSKGKLQLELTATPIK